MKPILVKMYESSKSKKTYSDTEVKAITKKFQSIHKDDDELNDLGVKDIRKLLKIGYSPEDLYSGKISLDDIDNSDF